MIWDSRGRLLLQRRAIVKYHSGGLWTNSCCGHPRPGENVDAAAERRLEEEMGISCTLAPRGTFTYRADLDAGLIEHELVHLFHGIYRGAVAPDPGECDGYSWSSMDVVRRQIDAVPQAFSVWFKKYVEAEWPVAPPDAVAVQNHG
jgi:isopentenyl-diphosphate delta-isomerase